MYILGILFIIVLTTADQFSKQLIVNNLPLGEYISVIPNFLELTHTGNTGSAFGMFSEYTWLLAIIALIALVIFGFLFKHLDFKKRVIYSLALILIISGTIGNFIDRVFRGEVIDMISFIFGNWRFWTFNYADSYLSIGVVLMLIDLLIGKNELWKK
ncbi:MAG: signal peptidase II [Bacilli bacterium]|nr:signal peptidase II [Bacilli bacterium]